MLTTATNDDDNHKAKYREENQMFGGTAAQVAGK